MLLYYILPFNILPKLNFLNNSSCWNLNVAKNEWKKVGGFQTERFRAASVAVNNKMIVLGGRDVDGLDIILDCRDSLLDVS